MKLKNIVLTIAALAAFFVPNLSWATCSNYTTYVDGQVLTAGSLNSLQSTLSACSNAILDGDTFTGDIVMHSGSDLLIFSDTGSNLEAALYGADGDILGAIRQDGAYGIDLELSSGVFTVQCEDAACSASNPGFIRMQSTTAGDKVVLRVTSSNTFSDRTATSDLTSIGFGLTETVDWNQDIPFFLYVINRANGDVDGSDGGSVFAISRDPTLTTSPSSADDIHDTDSTAANDTQDNIFILDDVTNANYTSLPMLLVGAIRMQWDTDTADDWTIQALGNNDGIGQSKLDKTFATVWTFPAGQNGNEASYWWTSAAGGEVPTFATPASIDAVYQIGRDGFMTYRLSTKGAGACTQDGAAGSDKIYFNLPLDVKTAWHSNSINDDYVCAGGAVVGGVASVLLLGATAADTSILMASYINSATATSLVENNWCSNSADDVAFQCHIKVY